MRVILAFHYFLLILVPSKFCSCIYRFSFFHLKKEIFIKNLFADSCPAALMFLKFLSASFSLHGPKYFPLYFPKAGLKAETHGRMTKTESSRWTKACQDFQPDLDSI